jgi:protein gp37
MVPPYGLLFISFEPLLASLGDIHLKNINWAIVGRLRRLVDMEGFRLPEIYSPEELSGE